MRDHRHDGVDLRGDVGGAVIASADGVVRKIWVSGSAGIEIVVEHPGYSRWTRYVHLQTADVKVGDAVLRGQRLGEIGLFQLSGGVSHVHWMLCTAPHCYGYGPEGHTADPMEIADGCFEKDANYPHDRLLLTLPFEC